MKKTISTITLIISLSLAGCLSDSSKNTTATPTTDTSTTTIFSNKSKTRDTIRIMDLLQFQKALTMGYIEMIDYPTDSTCIGSTNTFEVYKDSFGGKIPQAPTSDETITVQGLSTKCVGQYAYVYNAKDKLFGLYAKMELQKNANVSCSKLAEDYKSKELPATDSTSEDWCYAAISEL